MRWCSSEPPAIWPTRRSSQRCRAWSSSAGSTSPSSAWPGQGGTLSGCGRAPVTAWSSTAASTPTPSPNCRPCSATSTATTATPPPSPGCGRRSAMPNGPCTTWRSRPACSRPSPRDWPPQAALGARAWSWRSRSGATWLRQGTEPRAPEVPAGVQGVPDGPLSGQGAGAEHPLPAVRQRAAGAALERRLRARGADHHGRGLRRAGPRRLLRGGRRHPRRAPEPPAAGPRPASHGPAGWAWPGRRPRRAHAPTAGRPAAGPGQRLPLTATEVVVEFRRPPLEVFGELVGSRSNHLRLRLSPDMRIALGMRVKVAGEQMVGEDVELVATDRQGEDRPAYERLLGDALEGDGELFAREDTVEAEWQVVEPILGDAAPLYEYEPGTWGPEEADQLRTDGGWSNPTRRGRRPR